MRSKKPRKLALHSETLHNLASGDLGKAAGGVTAHTFCLPCPSGIYSMCQTWCLPCPTVLITCPGPPRNC